jgi:hypothetical protein
MAAGLWALWFLAGLIILLALLSVEIFSQNTGSLTAFFPFLVIIGAIPLLAFLFVCLWGISRGHRSAAVLALFVPVFLSLPLVTEVIALNCMELLKYSADNDARFLWFIILFRLLMLAVLVAAWPLAFGTTNPFPRILALFRRCFKACSEKCFGKLSARWKRHLAPIHAEEARVLFEAVAALRKREGMPIESIIASYDDIERRYGQDEAPAVRFWVERALQEKDEILRAQSQTTGQTTATHF